MMTQTRNCLKMTRKPENIYYQSYPRKFAMPLMPRPCLSSILAGSAVVAAVSRKQVTLLVMDWKLSLSVSVVFLALSIADILGIDMLLLMESWCGEEIVKVILRRRMVESEGLSKEGVS